MRNVRNCLPYRAAQQAQGHTTNLFSPVTQQSLRPPVQLFSRKNSSRAQTVLHVFRSLFCFSRSRCICDDITNIWSLAMIQIFTQPCRTYVVLMTLKWRFYVIGRSILSNYNRYESFCQQISTKLSLSRFIEFQARHHKIA